ncbi:MAG: hypothetical protein GYB66_14840 [Chloroflexi bacterium]|nr:hypothetical protein [Chloroflexota bacterium]
MRGLKGSASKRATLHWTLVVAALSSVLFILTGALILSLGAADPPRARNLILEDSQLTWAGGVSSLNLAPKQVVTASSPHPIDAVNFSLEGQARLSHSSDPLASWGLWLEMDNGQWLVVGVNGSQYVTVRYCPAALEYNVTDCPPAHEPVQQISTFWKVFHHIRPRGADNHLHLVYVPERQPAYITLYLNGERMWDIAFEAQGIMPRQWGLWGQGGPARMSQVTWQSVRLFQE